MARIDLSPHSADLVSGSATVDRTTQGFFVGVFDSATSQHMLWVGVIPDDYSGGDLTVTLYWRSASATSGNVVWEVSFARYAAAGTSLNSAPSFGTSVSDTEAPDSTAGSLVYTPITVTNGQAQSIAAGEVFLLRILRNGASGSDTMTGDAELLAATVDA